jgi:hypothetical protein
MSAHLTLMLNAILIGIRFVILVFSGHKQVALENAALRQQVLVLKRQVKRPRLQRCDRLFWMSLRTIWANWKSALMVVRPETVISGSADASNDIGGDCRNRKGQDARE